VKKLFVADLRVGTTVSGYFVLSRNSPGVAKNGNGYVSMSLTDRTGTVPAIIFDANVDIPVEAIVGVKGNVEEFNKRTQLKLIEIRPVGPVDEGRYDISDFIPSSDRPAAEMICELYDLINLYVEDERAALLLAVIDPVQDSLGKSPAAKMYHHAFRGGLLEHILELVRLAIATRQVYPDLDLSVLIAGAALHDIGKLAELSPEAGFAFTTDGLLFGHVGMGFQMMRERLALYDHENRLLDFRDAVLHIIASHHGTVEHGALVAPCTKEAVVFHHLDMISSRMGAIHAAELLPSAVAGWTAVVPMLKIPIWKGTKCPKEETNLAIRETKPPLDETISPSRETTATDAQQPLSWWGEPTYPG
jgi:3'-5' exoribonuclease